MDNKTHQFILVVLFWVALQGSMACANTTVTDVIFDWSTRQVAANATSPNGTDNWPITWSDDGHQYSSGGDGYGFEGNSRRSLVVSRIEGNDSSYQGFDVWENNTGASGPNSGGKSYGIVSIDGVLYMWVLVEGQYFEESRLYRSTDYGVNWTAADWTFSGNNSAFSVVTILNFGQDYAGARDDYVYLYTPGEKTVNGSGDWFKMTDEVYMARVLKTQMMTESAYEFLSGYAGNGDPTWSSNIVDRSPVLTDPGDIHWTMQVGYSPGLDKYFLFNNSNEVYNANTQLDIYQADEPWGPWTIAKSFSNWGPPPSPGYNFTFYLAPKWISNDGLDFTMVFSGTLENDAWNTVKGSFVVDQPVTNGSVYPDSTFITDIDFDMSTVRNTAPGNSVSALESDNWAITWADDGHQYTSFGDGIGFATSNNTRASFGVSRIEGGKDSYSAYDTFKSGSGSGGLGGKSYGIISIDSDLYLWRCGETEFGGNGSEAGIFEQNDIWKSTDRGANWSQVGVQWRQSEWALSDPIFCPTFLQFGQDYAGARDNYVYSYAPHKTTAGDNWEVQSPGRLTLMRVDKNSIENKAAYEYFAGFSGSQPTWTSNLQQREPVFEDNVNGVMRTSVSYNPGLDRYLLITQQVSRFRADDFHIGVYEAPEPWGPWSTILFANPNVGLPTSLNSGAKTVYWNFANKWLSPDGKNFVMVYTGPGPDEWGTVEGSFTTAGPTDSTPPSTPTGLSATAISASQINLSWQAASDNESGVSSYRIYRDGSSVGSSFNTSYSDLGLDEGTSYSYRVAAINGSGLEGSQSSAQVGTTIADDQAPTIDSVIALGTGQTIQLRFSEPVSQAGAETTSNYSINNGVMVSAASLLANQTTVVLTTSQLSEGVNYQVTVSNVTDQAVVPNTIDANSQATFEFVASFAGNNTNPAGYTWGTLEIGAPVYIDRGFTYTLVGSYDGFAYLQTANTDKSENNNPFLTFDINREVSVYVGYDIRNATLPTWLMSWTDSGDQVSTDDTTFTIYQKVFAAGQVALGGNEFGNSMYMVAVGPATGAPMDTQPVANDDSATTSANNSVTINVLANDSGLADSPITLSIANAPPNGIAIAKGSEVEYTPNSNFSGTDTLSYRIQDSDGDMASATVTITVNPAGADAMPFAEDDTRSTPQDEAVTVSVTDNDSGLEDAPITASIVTAPNNGTAIVVNNASILYTPNSAYIGADTLTYQVTDSDGDSDQATLTLAIFSTGSDDQPIALPDNISTAQDTAVNVAVLDNDAGLSDTPVTLTISTTPANGSAIIESDSSITYTPNAGFNGSDSLIYRIIDSDGDSAQATLMIVVNAEPATAPEEASGGGGATQLFMLLLFGVCSTRRLLTRKGFK